MSTIINLTSSRFKLKSHQINLWVKNLHLSNSNSLTVSVLCCSVCTIVFLPLSFGVRGGWGGHLQLSALTQMKNRLSKSLILHTFNCLFLPELAFSTDYRYGNKQPKITWPQST